MHHDFSGVSKMVRMIIFMILFHIFQLFYDGNIPLPKSGERKIVFKEMTLSQRKRRRLRAAVSAGAPQRGVRRGYSEGYGSPQPSTPLSSTPQQRPPSLRLRPHPRGDAAVDTLRTSPATAVPLHGWVTLKQRQQSGSVDSAADGPAPPPRPHPAPQSQSSSSANGPSA